MTAQFVIIDTNSLVELPFDISNNSESAKVEVKTMPGFRANKLGSSYADGSVKFESKNAGSASLTAHLDNSPGMLTFDLKGVKGGSPSAYSGITFLVSESTDGQQWSTVATLNESEIGTSGYTHLGPYMLNEDTRYVRWLLASASSGNTQLNNIAITLHQADDSTGIHNPVTPNPDPYPNPAQASFRWQLCEEGQNISLYNLSGDLVRQWNNVSNGETMDLSGIAAGSYILHAKTPSAMITKKLIIK